MEGVVVGVAFGLGILVGVCQLPAWLLELLSFLYRKPMLNELGVISLPSGLINHYLQPIQTKPESAIATLRPWLRNSFRSHTAFHVFNRLLQENSQAPSLLYHWLRTPQINDFINEPLESDESQKTVDAALRKALLEVETLQVLRAMPHGQELVVTFRLMQQALVSDTALSKEQVIEALQALKKRDVVSEENGAWRLLMPLFQRWLQINSG